MSVALRLQQSVELFLLREEVHVVVLAIIANLFHHDAHAGLEFADEACVFDLFPFEGFDGAAFAGKGALEFGDSCGCSYISTLHFSKMG